MLAAPTEDVFVCALVQTVALQHLAFGVARRYYELQLRTTLK